MDAPGYTAESAVGLIQGALEYDLTGIPLPPSGETPPALSALG
jgi:hypothetical protein